jgi:hypothetical protein
MKQVKRFAACIAVRWVVVSVYVKQKAGWFILSKTSTNQDI